MVASTGEERTLGAQTGPRCPPTGTEAALTAPLARKLAAWADQRRAMLTSGCGGRLGLDVPVTPRLGGRRAAGPGNKERLRIASADWRPPCQPRGGTGTAAASWLLVPAV